MISYFKMDFASDHESDDMFESDVESADETTIDASKPIKKKDDLALSAENQDAFDNSPDQSDAEDDVIVEDREEENYEEIEKKKNKQYSKKIMPIPIEKRRSSDLMTLAELTECVNIRAGQISEGSPVFVDITGLDDPIIMAKKEINEKRFPLTLRRKVNEIYNREDNQLIEYIEFWNVNIMKKPVIYDI